MATYDAIIIGTGRHPVARGWYTMAAVETVSLFSLTSYSVDRNISKVQR